MLGNYEAAANDLRWYWNCQLESMSADDYKQYVSGSYIKKMTNKEFADRGYYNPASGSVNTNCYRNWDFTQRMSSDFVVPAEAVPYMNCVNDFRRYETAFDGLRFFDVKRWGIDYSHTYSVYKEIYNSNYDDAVRAIEVPWEAISGGMDSSRPTSNATDANSAKLTMNKSSFVVKTK